HLIFDGQSDNGNFYLGTHFWQMFMDEKDAVINNFLTNSFGRRSYYPPEDPARSFQGYYFSYNLIITANSYYTVSTYFAEGLRNDNIRTIAHKSINEQPGEAVRVYGQIRWPNPAHRVEILPLAYTWRAEPPIRFTTGTYPNASAVFGDFGMLSSLSWKPNNAVYIVQSTWLDLNDFSGVPTLIIYNGSSPLHLHGGTTFNGIIVAAGDVIIDNMAIRGSVISNGSIYLNNSLIEPDPYMLFSIPMHEEIRRLIFDFFKITSFNDATGRTEDVLNILGYVKISDFDLDTIPLEYFIPQLIEVQQVAN
ncbi:MAG: hypothetical protein FWC91_11845, partial [Defluviitaleaceae bacterium]|nr:hypothetical protein [Defluviitaleaceae bacterium]